MPGLRASTLALAAGLALSALPFAAQAAGLGRITVFSALGQPLQAEVEFVATPEELASMKAGLASPDSFKAAGLEYMPALQGIRFAIDRRADGQPVIRLSSERPIGDPFVDMLLELNWASGRLVREYTFLLDPPAAGERAATQVAAPVAPPPAVAAQAAPVPEPAPARPAPAPVPAASVPPAATPAPAPAPAQSAEEPPRTHAVQRGDTLRKIATANAVEGVSLEQMLVGMLRANPDAFDGRNMNRLKAGRILNVPTRAEFEAIPEAEARKVVSVQAADWNAYRRKLAAAAEQLPVSDAAGRQEAAGRITPKVEEKQAPVTEKRDQVRVSRTEVAAPGAAAGVAEADAVAKDKALREANERLAALEKNVGELQKLLEMKNQALANAQQQSAGAPAVRPVEAAKPASKAEAPKAEVKPAEPAKPAAGAETKPAEAAGKPADAKPVEPKAADAKPTEVKTADAKPAETKSEEAKPAEAKPAPKPRPKVVPPPPPEEPSFVETLMENPAMLAGGGGILALLLAFLGIKRRRAAKAAAGEAGAPASTLMQSGLSESSVFRDTGGQSVDTAQTHPQTDFSQAGPGTIDTDEVDPVAEADVYIAYGRDAQAEEILLEARAKDPERLAIALKLLEIYAGRPDAARFDALAAEMHEKTGGVGPDWEKVAALGRRLSPNNPLYALAAGAAFAAAPADAFDSEATVIVRAPDIVAEAPPAAIDALEPEPTPAEPSPAVADEALSLDFNLAPLAAEEATPVDVPLEPETPADSGSGDMAALDFDLGLEPPETLPGEMPVAGETVDTDVALDFELPEIAVEPAALTPEPESPSEQGSALDFDLGEPAVEEPQSEPAESQPEPADEVKVSDVDAGALDFDIDLGDLPSPGEPEPAPAFDMASISLDLDTPSELPALPDDVPEPGVGPEAEPAISMEPAEFTDLPESGGFGEVSPEIALPQASDGLDDMTMAEMAMPPLDMPILPDEPMRAPDIAPLSMPEEMPETLPPLGDGAAPAMPDVSNEEITTKLDLAKAYEEMGDFEGARELLQEVVQEGNEEQQSVAREALERIGG